MAGLFIGLLLAAPPPHWELTARAEGREGTSPVTGSQAAGVGQFDATAAIIGPVGDATGTLQYAPRLLLGDDSQGSTQLLHRGHALLDWRSGGQRIELDQVASIGQMDFSPLTGNQPGATPTTPLPTTDPQLAQIRSIPFISSTSTLRYAGALDRRWQLTGSVGYAVSGGRTLAARAVVPLQQGPLGSLGIRWTATAVDDLGLNLAASEVSSSSGSTSVLSTTAATWKTRLDPRTSFTLGTGVAFAHAEGGDVKRPNTLFGPVASAGIATTIPMRGTHLVGSAVLTLGPVIDAITGDAYERVEGRAQVGFSPITTLLLSASASGARNLAAPFFSQGVLQSEVSAIYNLHPRLALSGGARSSYLTGPNLGQPAFQWAGFLYAIFNTSGAF